MEMDCLGLNHHRKDHLNEGSRDIVFKMDPMRHAARKIQ